MVLSPAIYEHLKQLIGAAQYRMQAVGGGCINQTFRIETESRRFFCKINSASSFPQMLQKEKKGLELLGQQGIIRTPKVIDCAVTDTEQVLLLEWIDTGSKTSIFWKVFGEQLANLHRVSNNHFGLEDDNYMGSVPQSNKQENDWVTFFSHQRLQPLIDQCLSNGLLTLMHLQHFENIFKRLPELFTPETPALLHGYLWSGNFMCDEKSQPVLIDPAVYFGHRSMDLAMTTLFGGFEKGFYESYHYHFPLPLNYKDQWAICNLYPLLIHLLLFGKSYLSGIETTLKSYQ